MDLSHWSSGCCLKNKTIKKISVEGQRLIRKLLYKFRWKKMAVWTRVVAQKVVKSGQILNIFWR